MFESAAHSNRPKPRSDEDGHRWQESALRSHMLSGRWQDAAESVLHSFFDESTREFLPAAVLAFNPFKSFVEQTSTLYDDPVTVKPKGPPSSETLTRMGLTRLWSQQQATLRNVRGLRESFLCRSWNAKSRQVRYRVVSPGCIEAHPSKADPQQPDYVRELRKRTGLRGDGFDPDAWYWCWDEWDFRAPGAEAFRITYAENAQSEVHDVTLMVMPELVEMPRRLPYWSEVAANGQPVPGAEPLWPWTGYHHRVSDEMFDPYAGIELVNGTLIVATLWTYWVGGMRDVAFSQRWLMDAELGGVSPDAHAHQSHVPSNRAMVMLLRSLDKQQGGGSAGQWDSPMDVAATAESIASFAASLSQHAGVSQADTSIGNAGMSRVSGFAIQVSRHGIRRIEAQVEVPMMLSDQHNLAGAAEMVNAYGGAGRLPTEPEAWAVSYSRKGLTAEERRAELEDARGQVEAGLLHPADAVLRWRPDLSRDEAIAYLEEIAAWHRAMAAARGPEPEPDEDETDNTQGDEPDTEEGEADANAT